MNDADKAAYAEKLRQKLNAAQSVDFVPLSRAEFEARFVEPARKKNFAFSFRAWAMPAFAFAALLLTANFFWYLLPVGTRLGLDHAVSLERNNLLFGKRTLHADALIQGDLVNATPEIQRIEVKGYAKIAAQNARIQIFAADAGVYALKFLSGQALLEFPKNAGRRRFVHIADTAVLEITGTVVYVNADLGTFSVIEGQVLLNQTKTITAAQTYAINSQEISPLSAGTIAAASALADIRAYLKKTEKVSVPADSLPDKLFRKYGNAHEVSLKTGDKFFAAKVLDAESGVFKLMTLTGPVYVSEAEIGVIRRVR